MCFFCSLIPATFFVSLGYFALWTSSSAEGGIALFGRILACWVFVVAAMFPLCGAYMAFSKKCPMSKWMKEAEGGAEAKGN